MTLMGPHCSWLRAIGKSAKRGHEVIARDPDRREQEDDGALPIEDLPGMVGDYMSKDVVTFDIEDPISGVHACLMENTSAGCPSFIAIRWPVLLRVSICYGCRTLYDPLCGDLRPTRLFARYLRMSHPA